MRLDVAVDCRVSISHAWKYRDGGILTAPAFVSVVHCYRRTG